MPQFENIDSLEYIIRHIIEQKFNYAKKRSKKFAKQEFKEFLVGSNLRYGYNSPS